VSGAGGENAASEIMFFNNLGFSNKYNKYNIINIKIPFLLIYFHYYGQHSKMVRNSVRL